LSSVFTWWAVYLLHENTNLGFVHPLKLGDNITLTVRNQDSSEILWFLIFLPLFQNIHSVHLYSFASVHSWIQLMTWL